MDFRIAWVVLFLGLSLCPAVAQEQTFRVRRFDDRPELANVSTVEIVQDKIGFIWLATGNGLFRFDGRSFKQFAHIEGDSTSISTNNIFRIIADSNGNIWCGLWRGGVSRYDRSSGQFHNYPFTRKLDPSTTPITGVFRDRDGQVWAGVNEKGVARIDEKTGKADLFELVTAAKSPKLSEENIVWANQAYYFWQDPADGKIWATTRDGFYTIDPKTGASTPARSPEDNYDNTQGHNTWALVPDGPLLWSGGWNNGIQCIDRRTGKITQYLYWPNSPDDENTNIINTIVPKNEQEFWIGTGDRGLGVFNKVTGEFRFFDQDPGPISSLSKGSVSGMIKDHQGNLWMTHNGTLVQVLLQNNLFRIQESPKDKFGLAISDLFEDREGRFLFTSTHYSNGLRILDKKTGRQTALTMPNPPGQSRFMVFNGVRQAPDGTIWVITRHQIMKFNPTTFKLETVPQPPLFAGDPLSNHYTQFGIDPKGRLWLGTSNKGLLRHDPATGATRQFLPQPDDPTSLPTQVIGVVAMDKKGRCWYGSRDQTTYGYYSEETDRFVRLDPNGNPTKDRASQRANSIFVDRKGSVWVCTEAGLLHFDNSGPVPMMKRKYSIANGLPADYIINATDDTAGRIWGTTTHQLFCLTPETGEVMVFGKKDGFENIGGWVYTSQADSIMIYGNNRASWFSPKSMQPIKISARLALTSFRIDDKEQYNGSDPIPHHLLVVPADSRHFSFEVAAFDLANAEHLRFEYMFEGFDDQWTKTGTRRLFSFTNISAGNYVFKVKLEGAPDSEAIAIPLRVEVAFYKTTWFWLLIAAGLLVWAWWSIKNKRLQEAQMQALKNKTQLLEKEKAVVMYESLKQQLNPHFLFNSLTSLGSLIQIDPRSAAGFLENLSKTYRYILKSSEYETVSLQDELKFAEAFVHLQKTRFESGLEVLFEVPENDLQRKIVPVTLQNLLENAIKHNIIDEESPLVVRITVANGYLEVRNNLQKKKYVETSNRKGLAHLQSFYRYLSNRDLEIIEDAQYFTVKVPLL